MAPLELDDLGPQMQKLGCWDFSLHGVSHPPVGWLGLVKMLAEGFLAAKNGNPNK